MPHTAGALNIRFTWSLTPEDENTVAPALLTAIASLLDLLPIAYAIRIDTEDARVYQRSGPARLAPVPPQPGASAPPSSDSDW